MYEQEQDLEKAMDYFDKAVDLFISEDGTTSANQCRQRVAQIAAQLEEYDFFSSLGLLELILFFFGGKKKKFPWDLEYDF